MRALIRRFLYGIKWLFTGAPDEARNITIGSATPAREDQCQITIRDAVNGKILELSVFNPSIHKGGGWTHTAFVVKSDESLVEAVTSLLVLHKLTK